MPQDCVLAGAVISYPTLFTPKLVNGKGDPKFSATLILPANFDWGLAQAAIQEAIGAYKWPGGTPPTNLKMPYSDATSDGFPGQYLVKAYSDAERPPQVCDQNVQPIMDQSLIFAGCIVNAYIRFYGYPNNGGGIAAALNGVQIVQNTNVARLDNRKDVSEIFQAVPGAPAATAPMPGAVPMQQQPVQQQPVQQQPVQQQPVQQQPGAQAQGPAPMPGAPVPTPGGPAAWNQ